MFLRKQIGNFIKIKISNIHINFKRFIQNCSKKSFFTPLKFFSNSNCNIVHHMLPKDLCVNQKLLYSKNKLYIDLNKIQNIFSLVNNIEIFMLDKKILKDSIFEDFKLGLVTNENIIHFCNILEDSNRYSFISNISKINTNNISEIIYYIIKKYNFHERITSFPDINKIENFLTEFNQFPEIKNLLLQVFVSDIIICDCREKELLNKNEYIKFCTGHLLRFIRYIVCFSLFSDSKGIFEKILQIKNEKDSFIFKKSIYLPIKLISKQISNLLKNTQIGDPIIIPFKDLNYRCF